MFLVTARINFESCPENHSRVFGWQILKSVVPTDPYSTIFHNYLTLCYQVLLTML